MISVRLLVLFFLLAASAAVTAGQLAASPNYLGGTVTGSTGAPASYSGYIDGWGGSRQISGGGWVDCSGPITVKLKWNQFYPGEKKPSHAVIYEDSIAYAAGTNYECDNGIASESLDFGGFAISSGSRRRVVALGDIGNGEHGCIFTVLPFAHAENASPVAQVSYRLFAHGQSRSIEITFGETYQGTGSSAYLLPDPVAPKNSDYKVPGNAVGSAIEPRLSVEQYPHNENGYWCDNISWSVTGETFSYFNVAPDQASGSAAPVTNWQYRNILWRWSKPGISSVSCTATLKYQSETVGTITIENVRFLSKAPVVSEYPNANTFQVVWDGGPGVIENSALIAVDGAYDKTYTINLRVTDDTDLIVASAATSFGKWQYVQLVTPKFTLNGVVNTDPGLGLDFTYPYAHGGGPHECLFASPQMMRDSPGIPLTRLPDGCTFSLDHKFDVYVMYRGPETDSDFVTVGVANWELHATGSRPASTPPSNPTFTDPPPTAPVPQPAWSKISSSAMAHPTWSKKHVQ